MANTPLDTAIWLGEFGFACFPVLVAPDPEHPGKHRKLPLLRAWQSKAATDEATLEVMDWSRATHVGICCGRSHICVLDFDDLSQRRHLQPLGFTLRQTTISGGEHYVYSAPTAFVQGNTTHSPRPGVDIRGQGGFIVWYGEGEWADPNIELAPWPFGRPFSSGTGEDRDEPGRPDGGAYAPQRVKEGGRNADLIRAAGWWMRQNPMLEPEWLLTALLGHTERWHEPPLSPAEVRQVAESARRWHHEAPELSDWLTLAELPPAPPPDYLLGRWLVAGSVNLVHSRAGVGKTGLLTRILIALLSPRSILGWEPPEAPYGRKIGWVNGELPPYQFETQVRALLAPWATQVLTVDTRRQNLLERTGWLLRMAEQVSLLVLDTRSSLFRLDDSNTEKGWEPLNDLLREIADMGCTVFLNTHQGKGAPGAPASSFGSSAQEWFMDSIISLERPATGRWLHKDNPWSSAKLAGAGRKASFTVACEKNRHGPPFQDMRAWWTSSPQGLKQLSWEPDEED